MTAVLAVQNMQASGTIAQDIEFKALEGSLSMMSKGVCGGVTGGLLVADVGNALVLNDVLDL